ncbi:D-glycero-beta-D-manno-heptose-7-phosphate kinase [Aestuariispira insulae]|uniref:Bifunctional protein HldE n=1 Tax=Aestuariispira insulae TaxID=1461337 RepID=A0A3D9HI68_9PROT|nr:D-glycero-beta-D-manno-heptose-7-phosphate kinase [Aestuariispira insulae]RED49158.1 D-alpha,beta-D-heptose 7-phosphate 1-kinase /D-beta-D-heptose 1-phosphate adenylyltransferase [Aestuariispira insulae]
MGADIAGQLEKLEKAKVLCVGDLMLDSFVEGAVDRISPEAPIPVMNVAREKSHLGGAGNVARNLSALGVGCRLVAAIGDDAAGKETLALFAELPGVVPELQTLKGRPTTVKVRYLAGGQHLLRVDREATGPLGPEQEDHVIAACAEAMEDCGAVILSDYGKGILSNRVIAAVIEAAHLKHLPVLVDPKGEDFHKYRGATLLTPNRKELALAAHMPVSNDAEIVMACHHIMNSCGVQGLLATRSEQGMTLVHHGAEGEKLHHLSAEALEVFDVAGAGDTVIGTFAAGLAAGFDMLDAATLANVAAGVVVAKAGTAVAYPHEIMKAVHGERWRASEEKVAPLAAVADRVQTWKRQGLKVGFTNGCFDLLHPGHISLIDQSRAACDRLVVGLNSDASVKRLKGDSRPLQNEVSRATVLASLANVDAVVVFGEDTPMTVINSLKPDVLIKGADYTIETVVGAQEVQSWGGKVILADLVQGQSTTNTIAKMNGDK